MPEWKIHKKVYQLLGIPHRKEVDMLIDFPQMLGFRHHKSIHNEIGVALVVKTFGWEYLSQAVTHILLDELAQNLFKSKKRRKKR